MIFGRNQNSAEGAANMDYNKLRGVPSAQYMLEKYHCNQCAAEVRAVPVDTSAMHGLKLACSVCGKFLRWSGYGQAISPQNQQHLEDIVMENAPALQNTGHQALALAGDPDQALAHGQRAAKALMDFAQRAGAIMEIRGQRYLKSEGWLFLAKAFGVTVRIGSVDQITDKPLTFRASAEVLDQAGQVVGQGFGFCSASEKTWSTRPAFALASMAQTRATVRALRPALGWVPVLGGFEPTPSDEMPSDVVDAHWTPAPPQAPRQPAPAPASPPTVPGMATTAQAQRIAALCNGRDPLAECSAILGRTVKSSKEITEAEATAILATLEAEAGQNQGAKSPAKAETPQAPAAQPDMITEAQRRKIHVQGRELGLNKEDLLTRINTWLAKNSHNRVESLSGLTKWQASGLIDAMSKTEPQMDNCPI
jgi:hypothetical protein